MNKPKEWIKDGAVCWYQSSPGPEHRHAGVVSGAPRLLGGHTWVVNLREMAPTYRNGERKTVPAAACDALSPRIVEFEGRAGVMVDCHGGGQ